MGVVKKVVGAVGKVFGIDPGAQADAIREAAQKQADAQLQAAQQQAEATKQAAAAQVASVNQQAQATAQAQQATINQSTIANQIAAMQTAQPQTQVDLTSNATDDSSSDPRRRYMGSGSTTSVGGTSGGVGIRLT